MEYGGFSFTFLISSACGYELHGPGLCSLGDNSRTNTDQKRITHRGERKKKREGEGGRERERERERERGDLALTFSSVSLQILVLHQEIENQKRSNVCF